MHSGFDNALFNFVLASESLTPTVLFLNATFNLLKFSNFSG